MLAQTTGDVESTSGLTLNTTFTIENMTSDTDSIAPMSTQTASNNSSSSETISSSYQVLDENISQIVTFSTAADLANPSVTSENNDSHTLNVTQNPTSMPVVSSTARVFSQEKQTGKTNLV